MVLDTKLEVSVAMITASPQRRASIPEQILETAVVDGVLYYVILGSRTIQQVESGIPQDQIIGLLREPALGLVEGNLVGNPLFLERIFTAAAQTVSEDMVAEMKRFETGAIALFDQRVPDINARISTLIPDIIGVYVLDGATVSFDPNYDFRFISRLGFMELTPDIRAYLLNATE